MKCRLRVLTAIVAVAVAVVPFDVAGAQVPADDVEVILAIDASGSMLRAIDAAKAAANEFVSSMPAEVRIGVETFADIVTVLTPPTTDRALVTAQIDSIEVAGDTALYDVAVAASEHFTPTAEHKVLVLLSDGKDEGSLATLEDAITALQGVNVEAISLTTAETDLESLTALGPVTSAEDAAGVAAAFARVASLVVETIEPSAVPSSTREPPRLRPPSWRRRPPLSRRQRPFRPRPLQRRPTRQMHQSGYGSGPSASSVVSSSSRCCCGLANACRRRGWAPTRHAMCPKSARVPCRRLMKPSSDTASELIWVTLWRLRISRSSPPSSLPLSG